MTSCRHNNLSFMGKQQKKLRCCHCHLTIDEEELRDGYCPECREVEGVRRRDFEEMIQQEDGIIRYCCDDCGALIEVG